MKSLNPAAFVVSLVLAAFTFTQSHAGTLTKISNFIVSYEGGVEAGDSKKLIAYMEANPSTTSMRMNSPGGNTMEGYRLGYAIKYYKINTVVMDGQSCISACATAFMAGKNTMIMGILAFHVSWIKDGNLETNDALKQGQFLGSVESGYLYSLGYRNQFAIIVSQLTSADVFLIMKSTADLEMFRGDFGVYLEIPEGWISERIASSMRIHLMLEGY